jgi:hypothetical protein
MLIVGRHDYQKVHVAVPMRCTPGVGPEQDDLVGMKLLGDGTGIAMDHAHRNVRAPVHALGRKGKWAGRSLGHAGIVLDGSMSLPGATEQVRSNGAEV